MVVGFLPVFIEVCRRKHHGDLPVLGGCQVILTVRTKDIQALSFGRRDHIFNQGIIIPIIHTEIILHFCQCHHLPHLQLERGA